MSANPSQKPPPPGASGSKEKTKLSPLTELINDFQPVAAKWYAFGIQIGVDCDDLDDIKGEDSRVFDCFQSVLRTWLRSGPSRTTKKTLLEALRSRSLQENRLAEDLEKKLEKKDVFEKKDLRLLTGKLNSIASRWSPLGLQLGIDPDVLDGFAQKSSDVKHYLRKTLQLWWKMKEPTSTLLEALQSHAVGRNDLADKLKQKYGDNFKRGEAEETESGYEDD